MLLDCRDVAVYNLDALLLEAAQCRRIRRYFILGALIRMLCLLDVHRSQLVISGIAQPLELRVVWNGKAERAGNILIQLLRRGPYLSCFRLIHPIPKVFVEVEKQTKKMRRILGKKVRCRGGLLTESGDGGEEKEKYW